MLPPKYEVNMITSTELRHILAVYIMCACDVDLWPTYTKIGSRDQRHVGKI